MLNSDALSALSQLKKSIEDNKDYGEGIVRGTNSRFGFVNLEDGREVFLNPDEMQQVLPGDKVKVLVTENDRKKFDAKLEKLISSSLKEFVGQYVIKGKNHFVQADHPQLSRWLFVPPKERKKYQNGDFVSCKVSRHPFGDGKAQVKILQLIGKANDAGIERSMVISKFQLPLDFSEQSKSQVAEVLAQPLDSIAQHYTDMRDKNFVTIDAATTKDMDDAIYIEENDSTNEKISWTLFVAIADPSAYLANGSALDIEAGQRGSSAYLLGGTLSMFPTELSHDVFSLIPEQDRLALVCKMQITSEGEISSSEFFSAIIQSKHKLNYIQVSEELTNNTERSSEEKLDAKIVELLQMLHKVAELRCTYRSQHCIVQQDNIDYLYKLDKQGHIESVSIKTPTIAHKIVEEAMLATNCCAGHLLAEKMLSEKNLAESSMAPLFTSHTGFKPERINEIEQLLKKDFPDVTYDNLSELAGYIGLIKSLSETEKSSAIIPTLRRLLRPAELSNEPSPHFGLGFEHYAMVTSPIRRYQDLVNHRAIKAIISYPPEDSKHKSENKKNLQQIEPKRLQESIGNIRQASRQLDQWLLCEFLSHHINSEFTAKVAAVSSQGLAVRLVENGAESFIQMKNTKEKPAKYDSIRMTLTYDGNTYRIDQEIPVVLTKVDLENRQITLKIADKK